MQLKAGVIVYAFVIALHTGLQAKWLTDGGTEISESFC